jgi:hypothetical protein
VAPIRAGQFNVPTGTPQQPRAARAVQASVPTSARCEASSVFDQRVPGFRSLAGEGTWQLTPPRVAGLEGPEPQPRFEDVAADVGGSQGPSVPHHSLAPTAEGFIDSLRHGFERALPTLRNSAGSAEFAASSGLRRGRERAYRPTGDRDSPKAGTSTGD